MALISVVISVYNEEGCLETLFERLSKLRKDSRDDYEYLFVDDGSTDRSKEILRDLAGRYENVKYLFFSRNFGHEMAISAGLDHACGDAVVIIDADLQDPPEVIGRLIEKWREGYQIVHARRRTRKGETYFKKLSSWMFYRIIRWLSPVKIPIDTGDFRLVDKCVVHQFRKCREQDRFVRGLIAWTGFRQIAVIYDRDERYAGETKYNFFKLVVLAFDAVLGFSNLPLRIGILMGLLICTLSFGIIAVIFIQKIFFGMPVKGYALIVTGIFFLGGVQLSIIERPLYILAEKSEGTPNAKKAFGGPESLSAKNDQ